LKSGISILIFNYADDAQIYGLQWEEVLVCDFVVVEDKVDDDDVVVVGE
jgi:hypothetical protein